MTRNNMRHTMRIIAYGAVLAVAVAGVYFATRHTEAPAPADAGHNHAAMDMSSAAQPVMLTDADAKRIGVTFATAESAPLGRSIRTVGQVTFDETRVNTIALKIDGYIEQLYVNETGQPVRVGEPLLTIYSPMLVAAQEELLLAKKLERDVGNATDNARASASALVTSARRRLAYWDIPETLIAEIERDGAVRKSITLPVTVSGFVLEKNVLAGQKVMAGDALFKVADLSTVWVEGEVFEQDLAAVKMGLVVHADFQAIPGEERRGRIAYVYPTLNPDTRTVRVRVVFPNADHRLKPGMYATLLIDGIKRPDVLTVPRSAVLTTGERSLVFVREANRSLAPREVTIGVSTDTRIEIRRGLKAGETVVASATFLVDAESNLGTAMGGMGDMPGMEMTTPPTPLPPRKE